jgi:hypothetical protein
MKATFIETTSFTQAVTEFLADRQYAKLQHELMADPDVGNVMPGCGGLRKVRVADHERGKGKRGGARVIYLHVAEAHSFYLLDIYGKDEKDDLSPREKKLLSQLAQELKAEAIAAYQRWLKEAGT